MNKTNRKRGLIFTEIRNTARARDRFTVDDLLGLTRKQARANCHKLVTFGELRVIRPGLGRHSLSKAAIYTRTAKLSPTTPQPFTK